MAQKDGYKAVSSVVLRRNGGVFLYKISLCSIKYQSDYYRKKTKKIANAQKNSNANTHCTHLPLPAHTQANPKAKSKECNRQRYKEEKHLFCNFKSLTNKKQDEHIHYNLRGEQIY